MSTMHYLVSGALVEQFFDREKEDTRQWLRGEMDLLVDNMFAQLKNKFVNFVECGESTGQPNCAIDSNYQPFNTEMYQTANQYLLPPTEQANLNQDQANYLEPQVLIKEEEMDESDANWAQCSMPSGSTQIPQMALYAPIKDHVDDDEDCDCDRCVNGGIDIKEEYDDEDEGTMIDSEDIEDKDSDEDTWPPTKKRQRIDKGDNSPTNGNMITLYLECTSPECEQTFSTKDQLNEHLLKNHDIQRYRCVVKNCHRSFAQSLKNHFNTDHANTTQWQCDHCPKYYTSYKRLYDHTANFHHLGQYQCAFAECTFVAKCKGEVDLHQKTQHKRKDLVCSFPGCQKKLKTVTRLKAHERSHLGIAPYRCKWPDCGYSNAARSNTMNHIRKSHLDYDPKKRSLSVEQVRQYLEVVE